MSAGMNLGIDTDKLNDLVRQASQRNSQSSSGQCIAIPEESEELTGDLSRKIVRRTIIFPTSALVDPSSDAGSIPPSPTSIAPHSPLDQAFGLPSVDANGNSALTQVSPIQLEANADPSEEAEIPFRSLEERSPTPPPTHHRHSRRTSQDVLIAEPLPRFPLPNGLPPQRPMISLALPKQSNLSAVTASPTTNSFLLPPSASPTTRSLTGRSSYADSFLDFYGREGDTEDLVVAQGRLPAPGQQASPSSLQSNFAMQSEDGNTANEIAAAQPGDRVEVDEMGDGSLV